MINVPIALTSTLPALKKTTIVDVFTNPIGTILNHRQEMRRIEYEIEKLEHQTQIIIKNIDSQLTKSLDENQKNYDKEMKRLNHISKTLKSNNKRQDRVIEDISELSRDLSNPNLSLEEKKIISDTITIFHQSLNSLGMQNIEYIDSMSGFNPNQKLIKG